MQAIFGKEDSGYAFNLIGFLRATLIYDILALVSIYVLSPQITLSLESIDSKTFFMGLVFCVLIVLIELIFLHGLRCWQKSNGFLQLSRL